MNRTIKVCVIGHFGEGEECLNGQTVKTKIITEELRRQLGGAAVRTIDSRGGAAKLPKLFAEVGRAMHHAEHVIMLPASNGVRFFGPVLSFWKRIYRRKIHYIVIGAWLSKFLAERRYLRAALRRFDGIYVETVTLQNNMEALGFHNVKLMPNCKELRILREEELVYAVSEPYRLCTFSRVVEKKGIEDAVKAVCAVNGELGRTAFTLDVYGPVDEAYRERFEALMASAPEEVQYRGSVPFDRSVELLKGYYALLFPTRFYTEGIPGTIIDAYASGVPVISARWESFADLVDEGEVGLGYAFGVYEELLQCLRRVVGQPELLADMKRNCLKKAHFFTAGYVVGEFIEKGLHYERSIQKR